MEPGYSMQRRSVRPLKYNAMGGPHAELVGAGIKTMRALCAHGLVHVDGGATDPERKFVLTERGRFVLEAWEAGMSEASEPVYWIAPDGTEAPDE